MAVLGSVNQLKKMVGPAQVYLVAYPSAGYTGGTDALRITNVYSQFFSDSGTGALRILIPSAYSDIEANGIDIDLAQSEISYDPNMGSKYKLGNGPSSCTIKWKYKDIEANKILDAFSCLTGDMSTTTAAVGVAGRKSILVGRQSAPLLVAVLVRYPTATTSAGSILEFQNIILPMATMTPQWKLKVDKKSAATAEVTVTGICDMTLIGTQAMPPVALVDDITAAGT